MTRRGAIGFESRPERAMVEVRRAHARDCETIARLSGEAVREAGGHAAPFEPELVRKHAFGPSPLIEIFVAEERRNGPLLGHAVITKSFDTRHAAVTVTLCELYVRPEARRAGTARTLIAEVAKRVAELGARELIITTGVEDMTARKFFSAVGAKEMQAVVFRVNADGVQWLAAEAR